MKIKLEFDSAEDKLDSRCAIFGVALWSALWDIDSQCRNRMKHADDVSDAEYRFLEKIRELCYTARYIEEEL